MKLLHPCFCRTLLCCCLEETGFDITQQTAAFARAPAGTVFAPVANNAPHLPHRQPTRHYLLLPPQIDVKPPRLLLLLRRPAATAASAVAPLADVAGGRRQKGGQSFAAAAPEDKGRTLRLHRKQAARSRLLLRPKKMILLTCSHAAPKICKTSPKQNRKRKVYVLVCDRRP